MSYFLEIIVKDAAGVPALVERKAHWGEEELSLDPAEYAFKSIRFRVVPVAEHVRQFAVGKLKAHGSCLSLDSEMLYDWLNGRLRPESLDEISEFLCGLEAVSPWLIVLETDRDGGIDEMSCAAEKAFGLLAERLKNGSGSLVLRSLGTRDASSW